MPTLSYYGQPETMGLKRNGTIELAKENLLDVLGERPSQQAPVQTSRELKATIHWE